MGEVRNNYASLMWSLKFKLESVNMWLLLQMRWQKLEFKSSFRERSPGNSVMLNSKMLVSQAMSWEMHQASETHSCLPGAITETGSIRQGVLEYHRCTQNQEKFHWNSQMQQNKQLLERNYGTEGREVNDHCLSVNTSYIFPDHHLLHHVLADWHWLSLECFFLLGAITLFLLMVYNYVLCHPYCMCLGLIFHTTLFRGSHPQWLSCIFSIHTIETRSEGFRFLLWIDSSLKSPCFWVVHEICSSLWSRAFLQSWLWSVCAFINGLIPVLSP